VPDDLDEDVDRERGTEGDEESEGVVVGERPTEDAPENGRVGRPDRHRDHHPSSEPAPRLTRHSAGDGEGGPSSRDEPGGHEQQPAAIANHDGRSIESIAKRWPPFGAVIDPCREPRADQVRKVVAEEGPDRAGSDHEEEVLLSEPGGHTADDDGGLARHDRDDRVEEGDDDDHDEEPPSTRRLEEEVAHFEQDNRNALATVDIIK